jgi:hypothetical protein
LTTDQMEVPEEIVAEIFQTFDLDEIRRMITDIFLIAICVPRNELRGYGRSDLSFTQTELIRLVEATFLLYKPVQRKSS